MLKIVLLLISAIWLYGCDTAVAERSMLRLAMETGFKSGCEEDAACVEEIEKYVDQCLPDADLDTLMNTSFSDYDQKATDISTKVISCIHSQ